MSLIVKSFTFVECTKCHKTMKLEVGKDIDGIRCECSKIVEVVEEEKPKRRVIRKKVEDATETI